MDKTQEILVQNLRSKRIEGDRGSSEYKSQDSEKPIAIPRPASKAMKGSRRLTDFNSTQKESNLGHNVQLMGDKVVP